MGKTDKVEALKDAAYFKLIILKARSSAGFLLFLYLIKIKQQPLQHTLFKGM